MQIGVMRIACKFHLVEIIVRVRLAVAVAVTVAIGVRGARVHVKSPRVRVDIDIELSSKIDDLEEEHSQVLLCLIHERLFSARFEAIGTLERIEEVP